MKFYVILFTLFMLSNSCTNPYKNQKDIFIIAKGQGGDMNGAIILKEYFENKGHNVELKNDIKSNNISDSRIIYLFIGQDAALDFYKNFPNKFPLSNIFIYTHLVSQDVLSIIKDNPKITLITPAFQVKMLKSFPNVITIPLAIPTYLKSKAEVNYINNKPQIEKILINPVIHLGGSYKDRNGNYVLIDDKHFNSIESKISINRKDNISIIIHPRTFKDIINNIKDIKNRLTVICKKNGIKKTHFFVNKDLYDVIVKNKEYFSDFNIELSPPYDGILYAINELNIYKAQFVSVDQYNAFADIKHKVKAFLLNDEDKDQLMYLKHYKKTNLNNDILKNFLQVKKLIK